MRANSLFQLRPADMTLSKFIVAQKLSLGYSISVLVGKIKCQDGQFCGKNVRGVVLPTL